MAKKSFSISFSKCELYFEENVLYDFVESESNDFYDFLD